MTKRNFHKQSLMGIFLSYFRPHMGLFLLDMVCALVISLVDLGFPYLSRMCMYELIPEGRFQAFVAVILILSSQYFKLLKDYKARYLSIGKMEKDARLFYEDGMKEMR